MATAARISKEINVSEISINWMFCEWLSTYLYASNPVPIIEYRNTPSQDLDKTYNLQNLTFNDVDPGKFDIVNKRYPESDEQGMERALENMEDQKQSTLK